MFFDYESGVGESIDGTKIPFAKSLFCNGMTGQEASGFCMNVHTFYLLYCEAGRVLMLRRAFDLALGSKSVVVDSWIVNVLVLRG